MSSRSAERQARDTELVAAWEAARENAATREQVMQAASEAEQAEALAEEQRRQYIRAVVEYASVHGFTEAAELAGVTSKQVHVWHKKFAPEVEDLSHVPGTALARVEREAERVAKQMAAQEALARRHAELQNKINELKKGSN